MNLNSVEKDFIFIIMHLGKSKVKYQMPKFLEQRSVSCRHFQRICYHLIDCQFPKEAVLTARLPSSHAVYEAQSKVIHPPWLLKAEMKTEHWGQITGGWGSDLGVGVDAEVAQGMC